MITQLHIKYSQCQLKRNHKQEKRVKLESSVCSRSMTTGNAGNEQGEAPSVLSDVCFQIFWPTASVNASNTREHTEIQSMWWKG